MAWEIRIRKAERKRIEKLPALIQATLITLIREMEIKGPVRGNWPNYKRLRKDRHHCHLKKGHPAFVAVWEVRDNEIKLIEVTMPELTKKHLTDFVDIRVIGPIANRARALDALKNLGFMDATDSVPWREAFPKYQKDDLPGVALQGARTREELTQARLSELTGIPQRHLSMMEHGKRPIGKKNAQLLAKVLKVDYRIFL